MNNVFMLALMVAPIVASAAWSVGSVEIGPGNSVKLEDVMRDGHTPDRYAVAYRPVVSSNMFDLNERSMTYGTTAETKDVEASWPSAGFVRIWRIGLGTTMTEAKTNIVASAIRFGEQWTVNGTRSKPVMGIDRDRRVTVEFDPDGGSVIEVLGSEDLKTWAPATASSRFFKAVQRDAR